MARRGNHDFRLGPVLTGREGNCECGWTVPDIHSAYGRGLCLRYLADERDSQMIFLGRDSPRFG
jgi:hypothetical protein